MALRKAAGGNRKIVDKGQKTTGAFGEGMARIFSRRVAPSADLVWKQGDIVLQLRPTFYGLGCMRFLVGNLIGGA